MIGQLTHEEEVGRFFNTRIRFGSLASGVLKGYYQGGSCKAAMNMARAHQSHSVIYEIIMALYITRILHIISLLTLV